MPNFAGIDRVLKRHLQSYADAFEVEPKLEDVRAQMTFVASRLSGIVQDRSRFPYQYDEFLNKCSRLWLIAKEDSEYRVTMRGEEILKSYRGTPQDEITRREIYEEIYKSVEHLRE